MRLVSDSGKVRAEDERRNARGRQPANRHLSSALLVCAATVLAACGALPAPRQQDSVFPSPVAYVAAAPLPEATATPTLAPLPTPTLVAATAVPKQLPQESTSAIGLWSDNLPSAQAFPGFLDLAAGAAAFDLKQQRNQRLVTLTAGQAQTAEAGSAQDLRANRPGWLLFDRNRRVVMSSADEGAPVLDIRNDEVRNKLAEDVANAVAQRDYEGIVVNGIGVDIIRPSAAPIFTGTKVFTTDQRRDAVEGLLRAIRSRVPDKLLIIGGYAWRDGTAFGALAEEAQNLATLADGVHIDAFLRSPISRTNEFKSEANWKKDVDYLSAVSQDNKVVLLTTRLPAGSDAEDVGQWLSYSVASYLLGKNGAHTYFQFDAGDPALSSDPLLSAPLGAPVEAYIKLDSGVYQRRFEKGLVLVNPTNEQKKATIEGQFKTLAGNPAEANVTLGPRTGVILLQQ
jgi:hypothetical protein